MKKTSQICSGQTPIRGPEWSNAQVTRTSMRVEPLSNSQLQVLRKDSIQTKVDQHIQKIRQAICARVPGLKRSAQTARSVGQRAVSEKCLFAATNTDDFRKLKKELSATGVVNINNVVIVPVVGEHECLHASMQSWGPRAA